MIRIPYKLRRPEGVKSGFPGLRSLHYKLDCVAENLFIRLVKTPSEGTNKIEKREESVTVSLTSFPARINKVYYAIKSLMLQTYKADRIVLWLAEEQFPNKTLPKKIEKLQECGLTVRWCQNLRSHKKYHYALQEQKENELVITYDDDLIYEADSIEKLIKAHALYKDCIICNRGHEICFDKETGELLPYVKWKIHSAEGVASPSLYVMPSTGDGCLYPYGCMPEITFDFEIVKENALTADDLWMRFCSLQNEVLVLKTRETIATLCVVGGSQKERLTQINDIEGENQRVIERLLRIFPKTFSTRTK
ncbi:MAG: hypothetical protein IJV96_00675 [Clostridia bacterium]|nr:hypothetical protein [Clostridia bacterium]